MIIADLNYLEVLSSSAIVGAGNFDVDVDKKIDVDKHIKVRLDKFVDVYVDVRGNLGDSEATAQAYGKDTLAETETIALAYEDKSSDSYSSSIAAVY